MIVSVTNAVGGCFSMTVAGARHCHGFTEVFHTMDEVWQAARRVSEMEADYHMEHGKGWGS